MSDLGAPFEATSPRSIGAISHGRTPRAPSLISRHRCDRSPRSRHRCGCLKSDMLLRRAYGKVRGARDRASAISLDNRPLSARRGAETVPPLPASRRASRDRPISPTTFHQIVCVNKLKCIDEAVRIDRSSGMAPSREGRIQVAPHAEMNRHENCPYSNDIWVLDGDEEPGRLGAGDGSLSGNPSAPRS